MMIGSRRRRASRSTSRVTPGPRHRRVVAQDPEPAVVAALEHQRQMALLPPRRFSRRVLAVQQVQYRDPGVVHLVDLERRGEQARVPYAALERLQVAVQSLPESHRSTTAERAQDTRLKTIEPNTAGQKPPTSKPSSQVPTIQNRSPFSTKMNRPSVRIVTGSVSSTRTGRTTALIRPSTSAATSAAPKLDTVMDGIRYATAISATALISQTRASLRITAGPSRTGWSGS